MDWHVGQCICNWQTTHPHFVVFLKVAEQSTVLTSLTPGPAAVCLSFGGLETGSRGVICSSLSEPLSHRKYKVLLQQALYFHFLVHHLLVISLSLSFLNQAAEPRPVRDTKHEGLLHATCPHFFSHLFISFLKHPSNVTQYKTQATFRARRLCFLHHKSVVCQFNMYECICIALHQNPNQAADSLRESPYDCCYLWGRL